MSFDWKIATGEADLVMGPISRAVATGLLVVAVAACSTVKDEPESLPPQSVSRATLDDSEFEEYVVTQEGESTDEELEPPAEAEELDQPTLEDAVVADDLVVEQDDTLIVIEDEAAEPGTPERSLAESARAERQRRNTTQKTGIVITDKNLSDYATGQLTVSEESPEVLTNESLKGSVETESETEKDEVYWRERGYAIREAWKEASESVEELEADVFNLRMRFYAEDDPFYRDAQIKPAWDHAIEELNAAREDVDLKRQELEDFMEEGRLAGALPGWLREGIELEPVQTDEQEVGISEPGEPDLMDKVIEDPVIAPDPGEGGG